MNGPEFEHLREASLKRRLSPAEEARLQQHLAHDPRGRAEVEEDQALNRLLSSLPDAPSASNFTARVLEAARLEERRAARTEEAARRPLFAFAWLRRLAYAAVALGVGTLSYQQYQSSLREERARSVAAVTEVASLPSPEMLRDFDLIQSLTLLPADVDLDLLAALQ